MKKYLTTFAIGLLICLSLAYSQGLFKGPGLQESYRILSDGCFLAGVLIGGLGLLAWISGMGQFNGMRYLAYWLVNTFRWGFPRKAPMSYPEFLKEKPGKQRTANFLVIPGAVFLAMSGLFILLYNQAGSA